MSKEFLGFFFRRVFRVFFYNIKNYVNAELDKTEMTMNLKNKNRTLSTEIEY